jgi:DNA polymerase-3 subunit delta
VAVLKFSELKGRLKTEPLAPFYLITGEDAFFRARAEAMITEKAAGTLPELNAVRLADPSPKELLEALAVLPFMADKRVVALRDYYPKAAELNELSVSGLRFDTAVLLISNAKEGDAGKKLAGLYTLVDCAKEEVFVLEKWITAMFRAGGGEIEPAAARKLAEYTGQDMSRINGEAEKLLSAGSTVTEETIALCVHRDEEYEVYSLANAAAARDKKAFDIIKSFSESGGYGYAQMLLQSLYRQFSRMYFVKSGGYTNDRLAQSLGIKPYAVQKLRSAVAGYSAEKLLSAMRMLADADYAVKSGRSAGENALYFAVANITGQT